MIEEENIEKTRQQQQNLSEREKSYKNSTGKEYNPLVTDDDEYVSVSEPLDPIPSVSSLKTRRITPPIQSRPSKNKTKKKRPTPEGIELEDLNRNRPTPEQVPLQDDFEINDEYFPDQNKDLTPTPDQVPLEDVQINDEYFKEPKEEAKSSKSSEKTGFSETLIKPVKANDTPKLNKKVCENIVENGSKMNKAQFFPSEFPKLTRIKPITITVSNKKGGRRKTRKSRKNRKIK
jgi:hypothetical protein